MGTPDFASRTLERLVEGGYNVVAAVTQPDKPAGRHAELTAPAVKLSALERGIPVLQPVKMKDGNFLADLASFKADLQVVVAFRMLPEAVWAMPRFGTFNVHASLLPDYRGAAPINWALINGEKTSGVTTFMIDKDIDTGRIILRRPVEIPDSADAGWLYEKLSDMGAGAAADTVDLFLENDGRVETTAQEKRENVREAPKIFKETCEISWRQGAKRVYDFIRGLSPVPGAWSRLDLTGGGREETVKIYRSAKTGETACVAPGTVRIGKKSILVAAEDRWLEIEELQIAGKKRMKAADVVNGLRR